MSHEADELVLYADNDEPLYRQSFMPIVENLKKKLKKGTYSPLLAAKLWRYHADRAAQKYVKEFGGGTWHKVFSTKDRNEAAAHWESYARREYLGVTSHDRSRTRRKPSRVAAKIQRSGYEVWVEGDRKAHPYSNEAPMFVAFYTDKGKAAARYRSLKKHHPGYTYEIRRVAGRSKTTTQKRFKTPAWKAGRSPSRRRPAARRKAPARRRR